MHHAHDTLGMLESRRSLPRIRNVNRLRLFPSLLLVFCIAAPVCASTFHVDPVHGDDSSGDGSAAHPWRSLSHVLDDGLVETRDWPSLPYEDGMTLVTIHAGAPVKAGDTILLHGGDYGDVVIGSAYNASPIIIAAAPGETPRLRTLLIRSAQNWIVRGLTVSPSFGGNNEQTTIVEVDNHNWFGPAWDIDLDDLDIYSIDDASAWGPDEWVNLASSGVEIGADRVQLTNSRVRNVRFGIGVDGADALVRGNLVDGFSADGLRGLGDRDVFEYNRVQNNLIGDDYDDNHDDGFQSWSVGPGGVGTGEVVGVVLRGNVFINATDPSNPLRSSMQGIGCFDGFFTDWTVENNVVITDHWHGISFYGMRNSRIINNTVIDLADGQPGPPWIMVNAHKDGRPSENVVVRNNLAGDFSLDGNGIVADHNIEFTDAAALFVAAPLDLHLKPGSAAIDAGSAELAPPLDVEQVPRPQGAAVDLGAYEYRDDLIFANGFETTP
jgi:parallel beta-helix repeat protein